jgi:hypothetical protein
VEDLLDHEYTTHDNKMAGMMLERAKNSNVDLTRMFIL